MQYRVTGLARESDTQIDFVKADRIFFAPALTWDGEDTTLTLLAHYQRDDAGWSTQFLPASGTVLDNPNGDIPVSLRRRAGLRQVPARPGRGRLSVRASLQRHLHRAPECALLIPRQRFGAGLRRRPNRRPHCWRASAMRANRSWLASRSTTRRKPSSTPGRSPTPRCWASTSSYDFSDYGASRGCRSRHIRSGLRRRANGEAVRRQRSKQRQIGVYVQEQAKLFDKLVMVLGGRYDFARSDFKEEDFELPNPDQGQRLHRAGGLVYLFDNGLAPYFSYRNPSSRSWGPMPPAIRSSRKRAGRTRSASSTSRRAGTASSLCPSSIW